MKEKKIKLITKILAILIICLVSFVGVYAKHTNKMINKVKDYQLSRDLKGYRELVFKVSDAKEVQNSNGEVIGNTDSYSDSTIEEQAFVKTENSVNSEESLTKENYEKAKEIIEKRLKGFNVMDYTLSLDYETGLIHLLLPEDNETDHTISNILQVSKFEIKDSEDSSKVLLSNDDIKNVYSTYHTAQTGAITVYIEIELNENGKKTLKDISSGEYATKEQNEEEKETENDTLDENKVEAEATVSTENNSDEVGKIESEEEKSEENKETQKKIILAIDNSTIVTTSFDEPIEDGKIDLTMNQASTDSSQINETMKSAATIATVLDSGKMPITYKVAENRFVNTDISNKLIKKAICIISIITVLALLIYIIKYKIKGILATIAYIGFVALYLLVVRYTNINITLPVIVAGIITLIINYMVTCHLLKINEKDIELKKKMYIEELKDILLKLTPILIISIVFVFVKNIQVTTFGMAMFWGTALSVIYNYLVTKGLID